jgi:hypothetical protein
MNKRDTGARLRNHCCICKAISVTDSECLSVALVRKARAPYCHLWPVWLYTVSCNIIS